MEPCIPADLAGWKALARAGEAPTDVLLRKAYTADHIKADEDSRRVTFTISTGAVDRDNDTIKVEGWDLRNYLKNPVVLFAHDYSSLPVAKAVSVVKTGGVLKATAEFPAPGLYALADTVYEFLKGGYLRATSVGFKPKGEAYEWNEKRGGFDFEEQELLEFSVVPVPSNPEALMDMAKGLVTGAAHGLDLGPLRKAVAMASEALEGLPVGTPPPLPTFDPESFVKVARDAYAKRGRVLSQANEERIRRAQASAADCAEALAEVMGSMPMDDDGMDGKAATPQPVLYVAPSRAPIYSVNPETVVAAVVAAVRETVRAQINAARGRLD